MRRVIWKVQNLLPQLRAEQDWDNRSDEEKGEIVRVIIQGMFDSNGFTEGTIVSVTYLGIDADGGAELISVELSKEDELEY